MLVVVYARNDRAAWGAAFAFDSIAALADVKQAVAAEVVSSPVYPEGGHGLWSCNLSILKSTKKQWDRQQCQLHETSA